MVLKGIIKDNIVYCPKCETSKYQLTDDYKLVDIDGVKYVEFVARCLTCGEKFYFQSSISIETHYAFSRDREIEITDNK